MKYNDYIKLFKIPKYSDLMSYSKMGVLKLSYLMDLLLCKSILKSKLISLPILK